MPILKPVLNDIHSSPPINEARNVVTALAINLIVFGAVKVRYLPSFTFQKDMTDDVIRSKPK